MSRYIDAEKIPYTDLNADMPTSKVRVYVAFKERIDRVPTADVVEVVPCKDCKRWEQNKNLPYGNCSYHCSLAYATDWCSWGERREVGD